ncbi:MULTISPECIES: LysR family transcriptional regulator [Alteromonadaceae]|uniref:LysR family transcriptional regulator n=1 Tax=Alteromonadaceae TaxID=72275 RepID=UPI001C08B504|nr:MULTISPECIES: LysR family transcriptional regulator [Aliiglaciecola]MBU2877710.1 LysR family transcriptional regulator [Aliiglaciecola lipolytica]MDO6713300.1 LysR family transcriptional regulator [Aliiglaciecola sp. 2_MG-2023]MDO6754447.1 LysR family transcriptional regulator [Aliiglaciecola sp. 1_MG-2023]
MDRIDAMRVFTRVLERQSFTKAAEDLNIARSTVTDVVKRLEKRIGVVLLERTTRQVTPTIDGEAFYRRCLSIIQDVDDAETVFSGAKPKGGLRVDVHGTLARHFLMPKLPQFLTAYPDIELYMSEGDRFSDVIREGIDCVIRVGTPKVEDLVSKQIVLLEEVTVASSEYLRLFGTPASIKDLKTHKIVGFRATGSSVATPLEFCIEGTIKTVSPKISLTVNAAESLVAAARLGLGIVQVPRYHVQSDIKNGTLIPILENYPPTPSPVSILYPRNRQHASRVKVFIDWLETVFLDT